jgi:rhodanese-related sulfurtransferase
LFISFVKAKLLIKMQIHSYLNPHVQQFTLDGVTHANVVDCYNALIEGNVVLVDVREDEELDIAGFDVPNVIHHPLSKILDSYERIPKDTMIIVACNHGIRSAKVVNLLLRQGWKTVHSMDGGLIEWSRNNLPLNIKPHQHPSSGSCGCSCNGGDCGSGC